MTPFRKLSIPKVVPVPWKSQLIVTFSDPLLQNRENIKGQVEVREGEIGPKEEIGSRYRL